MVKEDGFSLLELSLAIGLAAILSVAVVSVAPSYISGTKQRINNYSDCSAEKEGAAQSYIEGEEYTGWDTQNKRNNSDCNISNGGQ